MFLVLRAVLYYSIAGFTMDYWATGLIQDKFGFTIKIEEMSYENVEAHRNAHS